MGNRFVTPEPVRLHISDGDFIDIKKRLNHGEREDMWARWSPHVITGEAVEMDRREVRTAKVLTYLIGWSFTDGSGTPVAYSLDLPEGARLDMLHGLDPDTFDEVHAAIEAHELSMRVEREGLKKTMNGKTASDSISASPSVVAGVSPTSVN